MRDIIFVVEEVQKMQKMYWETPLAIFAGYYVITVKAHPIGK